MECMFIFINSTGKSIMNQPRPECVKSDIAKPIDMWFFVIRSRIEEWVPTEAGISWQLP